MEPERVREQVSGTDFSFALVPTGMISVLSSFILSLLQAIQSLTDSAQDWMSSRSLAKCSGLKDLCSCVSSANKWYNVLWCLMTWPSGVMYMVNSTGPNTEP